VTVLLVRHARAGRRQAWQGDDRLRPLSHKGRHQAELLVDTLGPVLAEAKPPVQVQTSPWVRCRQTVEPLAAALDVEVADCDALGEGMGIKAVDLVAGLASETVVLCTHGDVIEEVLDFLRRSRVDVGHGRSLPKGSTWVLSARAEEFHVARYMPPPA
jgi:8-oxo-dGTP diphosphatase